jgi:hypothetical protein
MYGRCDRRDCGGASLPGKDFCGRHEHVLEKSNGPIWYAGPENLTRDGAEHLAANLRHYWADLGHPGVVVKVVPLNVRSDCLVYAVRSDLLNGLPRRTG